MAASEEVRPHIPTEKQGEHFQKIRSFSSHYPNTVFHLLNPLVYLIIQNGNGMLFVSNWFIWFCQSKKLGSTIKTYCPFACTNFSNYLVDKGAYVGYNQGWKVATSQIATLPIGHADGIGREFGLGKGL